MFVAPVAAGADGTDTTAAPEPATPRWAVHGSIGVELTPAAIFDVVRIQATYRVVDTVRVGVLLGQTVANQGGLEGCTTTDCAGKMSDAWLVAEIHGTHDSWIDPWVGLDAGPSYYWGGRDAQLAFSAHLVLGIDARFGAAGSHRPTLGVGLTGGAWLFGDEAGGNMLPGAFGRFGVEF
jgi:hypothetical protein